MLLNWQENHSSRLFINETPSLSSFSYWYLSWKGVISRKWYHHSSIVQPFLCHCSTVSCQAYLEWTHLNEWTYWMDILIYISYMSTINIPTELWKHIANWEYQAYQDWELRCNPKRNWSVTPSLVVSRDVSPGLGLHSTWRSLIPLNRQQSKLCSANLRFVLPVYPTIEKLFFAQTKYKQNQWSKIIQA